MVTGGNIRSPVWAFARQGISQSALQSMSVPAYAMHNGGTSENPDTGAIASLLNRGIGRGGSRTHREVLGSGNEGWRAGLGVRAGRGAQQVRGHVKPDHALRLLIERGHRGLRHIDRL